MKLRTKAIKFITFGIRKEIKSDEEFEVCITLAAQWNNQCKKEARNGPMFFGESLYRLELEKLRCMRTYFSYSFVADRDGDFSFKPWMDICIRLLEYIVEEGYNISEEQSLHVNVRNVRDIVDEYLIDDYNRAPLPSETGTSGLDKAYYGRQIYVRKAERLYYQIRLTPDTGNFANFVVPVVNAGATYCRRKCFRTVLGRKCRFVKQPSAVKCCNTFLGRKREKSAL